MRTLDVFYLVAVWFFILMLVSKNNRTYSAILFLFSTFNILIFDLFDFTSSFSLIDKKELLISLDGTLALIMTMVMYKEIKAMVQAKILIFMVLCHFMVVLHIINENYYFLWFVSIPFYVNYKVLIITSALLQIWVSRDGMAKGLNNALRGLQSMLFSFIFHYHRISKSLSERKKIKGGT